MGCKLEDGMCEGFRRGIVHCNKNCSYYVEDDLITDVYAEWVMAMDDFENGWGGREYPHCSNCHRGVYRHDAGSWCPFCGKPIKNPMRQ